MIMQMVKIKECSVTDCSYNQNQQCHTMAINVGSSCPMCDAYDHSGKKAGSPDVIGGIGACHQGDCKFNTSLECSAPGIEVGKHEDHAECETYTPK